MKFYQYTTGRSRLEGYGFTELTEGITFSNAAFRTVRDLSLMPQNSAVFELHGIDQQHTALVMTRVDSFGSGNYCYTHALITEQAAEPAALVQLLQPENFLTSEEFLLLEEAKARGEEMTRKELELPQTGASQREALLKNVSRRDVLHRFLGYLWNLCWQRSRGAEVLQPAVLVMPREMTMQQMLRFYTDCVLSRLPGELRQQASVVFGADPRDFGQFPPDTTCYVLKEPSFEVMPMFDLERGVTLSNADYTNVLVYELGKGLDLGMEGELRKWTLTRSHRKQLPGLASYSVGDFALAYRFQHLDMLMEQGSKSAELYRKHVLGRYRELGELLRKRYPSADVRRVLTGTERLVFEYWKQVSAREEMPPETYFDLVQRALTTPDDALWAEYLEELSRPCRLTEGESEENVLLGHGRWRLTDAAGGLEGLNHERFGLLMAARLRRQGDVMLARTLLTGLGRQTLECAELRRSVAETIERDLSSLPQGEVNELLESPFWQMQEKTELLDKLVEEQAINAPSGDHLLLLCDVFRKHRYEGSVQALVRCAQQIRMTPRESERLADALITCREQVKGENAAAVLALYEEQPHEASMRLLLEKLFRFDYDRSAAETWKQVETDMIYQAFVKDLSEARTTEKLLKVGDDWHRKSMKEFHCDWNAFPAFIPKAGEAVRGACGMVNRTGMIAELSAQASGVWQDWYGRILSEELGRYVQENLDALIGDPRNYAAMARLCDIAALPDCGMRGDTRIQIIALLSAAPERRRAFELLRQLDEMMARQPRSSVAGYVRYWAQEKQADTLEWEMALSLMAHWGDPQTGWAAFFKAHGWSPSPRTSPWRDDLFPMQALRHVCAQLTAAGADTSWRETLRRYLNSDPAWSGYVRRMESKREHRSFVRDEKVETPSIRAWLGLT